MLRVIAIGGEPCVGKTTLMREILRNLEGYVDFKFGLLKGRYYAAHSLYILGEYDEKTLFAGTDRLSMAVQPDAVNFLEYLKTREGGTILFEGDRLFNGSFLVLAREAADVYFSILLRCAKETLDARHVARKDQQSEQFLKGRSTKYARLVAERRLVTAELSNETRDELSENVKTVMGLFQRDGGGQPAAT